MGSVPRLTFKLGAQVWVWDSTWLPGVIVQRTRRDSLSIRLDHGVTFCADIANLAVRDPARRGADVPHNFNFSPKQRA
jgi:hypothetical protein